MQDALDLETTRDRLLASLETAGCCAVGVCNQEGLEGGPPSTDLTRQLEGARAALVAAYPVDEHKLELCMGRIDHEPYQQDYIRVNNIVQGLTSEATNQLRKFGYAAEVVYAGHPERKVRAKQLKMWTQGGVTVQQEDGRVEAMPADEARAFLDAMPAQRRSLYEDVED